MCQNCESDKREMWGPSRRRLELEIVYGGNWINLEKCAECSALWVHSTYEPYASFPYWVKWNYEPDLWQRIHDVEEGKLMHDWHMLQIKELWTGLSQLERESIKAHRKRSYGHYNPVDMPVESEEEIEKIITNHNPS